MGSDGRAEAQEALEGGWRYGVLGVGVDVLSLTQMDTEEIMYLMSSRPPPKVFALGRNDCSRSLRGAWVGYGPCSFLSFAGMARRGIYISISWIFCKILTLLERHH